MACRVEGAGPPPGFEYDAGPPGRRNQPVALQKPPFGRRRPAGQFGDDGPDCGDALEERVVTSRVEAVHSTGQERNGQSRTGQRGSVPTRLLYEAPNTDYAPTGTDGLFTSSPVSKLVDALRRVSATASSSWPIGQKPPEI